MLKAYNEDNHVVQAKDITVSQKNESFYCTNPNCKTLLSICALNSKKVQPYFSARYKHSQHIIGCPYGIQGMDNFHSKDYDTSDFTPEGFLEDITAVSLCVSKNELRQSMRYSHKHIEKKKISTLKQLFFLCCDDTNSLIGNIEKKKLLISNATLGETTSMDMSGIHLVAGIVCPSLVKEKRAFDNNTASFHLFLSNVIRTPHFFVHFKNQMHYNELYDRAYGYYKQNDKHWPKLILVYGNWIKNMDGTFETTINVSKQTEIMFK